MCVPMGIGSLGTGVTDSFFKIPRGLWESNLDPREEQPVHLTAEPLFAFPEPACHCVTEAGLLLVVLLSYMLQLKRYSITPG